jgi:hypothetical protein
LDKPIIALNDQQLHNLEVVMNALETLIAKGIPAKMAERIIMQATAEATPKKSKAARKFFPGMNSAKAKVDIEVDCTIICECCGNTWHEKKTIKALPDSPTEMKLPRSSCQECPAYFRAMTHEQLVSLALAAHNPCIRHDMPRAQSQVKLAKRLTPEEILNYTAKHY